MHLQIIKIYVCWPQNLIKLNIQSTHNLTSKDIHQFVQEISGVSIIILFAR